MRPLWVDFPEDEASFDIDYEHLIGSALLVRPVVTEGANTASVYFPPGVWYDVLDLTTHTGPSSTTVPAPRDKVRVWCWCSLEAPLVVFWGSTHVAWLNMVDV